MQFSTVVLASLIPAMGLAVPTFGQPAQQQGANRGALGAGAQRPAAGAGGAARLGGAGAGANRGALGAGAGAGANRGGAGAGGARLGQGAGAGTGNTGRLGTGAGTGANRGGAGAGGARLGQGAGAGTGNTGRLGAGAGTGAGAGANRGGNGGQQRALAPLRGNIPPGIVPQNPTLQNGQGIQGVSQAQIKAAVDGWMADTGRVTDFINRAPTLQGAEYTAAALVALNAEKDELTHKAILDFGLDPQSVAANNNTLATQGFFQQVVDALAAMVVEGPGTGAARALQINNNRCVNVLPNINGYFAAAGFPQSSAFVPTGCAQVAQTNPGSVVPTGGAQNGGNNNNNGNGNGNFPITQAPQATNFPGNGNNFNN